MNFIYKKTSRCLLSFGLFWLISTVMALQYPLPPALVGLYTSTGQRYLAESSYTAPFHKLDHDFVTQKNFFCGIASAVMVLNALQSQYYFTQENIFTRKVRTILTPGVVRHHGTGIATLASIFKEFGFQANHYYGQQLSLRHFRAIVKTSLSQINHYLIVQYSRPALHQQGSGHISPIAAYDQKTDRVLIEDVASFNYPPSWIKLSDLWKAMRYHSHFRGLLLVHG